jgi:DNA-binding beta-propeller fold protein YncE
MEGEVKVMRRLLMAVGALVLVAGCGATETTSRPLAATSGPLTGGNFRLYEAASTSSGQLVAVINSSSKTTERRLPQGALSPDGTHLYTVSSSTLQDIDPHSGEVVRTLQLPGSFNLPPATLGGIPGGLSQNGQWLVLQTHGAQTSSHMLLISTAQLKVMNRIDLDGTFEFDAIDNTGTRLYLIEYTNVTQGYYRVRVYEVAAGQLGSYTVVDKGGSGAPDPMTGVRLSGVFSPDGQWLYSVYARQNSGAFVHALNLTYPFAFCLDLPDSGSSTDAFHWSLALTADGKHLYAANGAMGSVTQIDNLDGYNPSIVRTKQIGATGATANALVQSVEAKELGANGAVLSRDGATLVTTGSTGLIWIDTSTLRVRSQQLRTWTVWSLVGNPDGSQVYALSDAGVIAELSMSDGKRGATFDPAVGSPIGLLRVEAG